MKLHRNRCKNIECITITYSNDRQNKADGWLVSSCTDVSTKNSKIVGDLIGDWGRLAEEQQNQSMQDSLYSVAGTATACFT